MKAALNTKRLPQKAAYHQNVQPSQTTPFPHKSPSLGILIRRNEQFKKDFKQNSLFKLMESGYFDTEEKRQSFLAYFQIWSNYFQKTMLLKTALCEDSNFTPMFYQHFEEEYGHDQMLIKDRTKVRSDRKVNVKKDAILEALCNWFLSKMLSLTPYEQIVVMNLCVEAVAAVFYKFAKPAIDPTNQLKHFQAHDGEIDVHHEKMGLSLLENLTISQYSRLFEVQEDAWAMCEALMERLGELVIKDIPSK